MLRNAIWLFVIAFLILAYFMPSFYRMQEKRQRNADYDQEIIRLKKKQAHLINERRLLESDPEYLEKVAREKMGLVKDGEVIYRLTPVNPDK